MGELTWTVFVALAGLVITVGGGAFKFASESSALRQLERLNAVIKDFSAPATDQGAAGAATSAAAPATTGDDKDALAILRKVRKLQADRLQASYSLGVRMREILKTIGYILIAFVGFAASIIAYNSASADTQFHGALVWIGILVALNAAGVLLGFVYLVAAILKKY